MNNITNSSKDLKFQNGSKFSNPASDSSHSDNPLFLPEKAPPFKSTKHKAFYLLPSISENYSGTRYNTTSSDRFNTQPTLSESISHDQITENRWLSKWSRDQIDLRDAPPLYDENPSSPYFEENRTSKTLTVFPSFPGEYKEVERSKSHSRTRSSPYGTKENHPAESNSLSPDFMGLRPDKEKRADLKERKKLERRRGVHELTPRDALAYEKHFKTEGDADDVGADIRFTQTEKVGSGGFFHASKQEKSFEVERHSKSNRENQRMEIKGTTAEREGRQRNQEYRETRQEKEGTAVYNEEAETRQYKGYMGAVGDIGERRGRVEAREYSDKQSRLEKLAEELREKEEKLKQMEKFQDQMYQNYVETKGELERAREENRNLQSNITYHMNQNDILKEKLAQLHEKDVFRAGESQKLRESQIQKSEYVSSLEAQIGKLKMEAASLVKKCEDMSESMNTKSKKFEREKQEILTEKAKLEKRMEEYLNQQELSSLEDRTVLKKSLEERNRQVKTLKQKNEELNEEIARLKKQKYESFDRHYASERETAVTGRYEVEKYETKKMLEEVFNQTRRGKNQDTSGELKKYKAEIERLRAENESLKLEVQGRSTFRRFGDTEASVEKMEGSLTAKDKRNKENKATSIGGLGKVMREIMKEAGIDDINEAPEKIKSIQEVSKTNNKFADGVLDLVYKCSPSGHFAARPTTKQAWKWLQAIMTEYMTMKKQKEIEEGSANAEKEIIKNLIDCLKVQDKSEIVEKVKGILAEDQVKKAIDKLKATGLDNSFDIGDQDKMTDKYGASYSSFCHSFSTAKFGDQSRIMKGNKEFSFARNSGPKIKKASDVESFNITEELVEAKGDIEQGR